jgi:hypothetical protein
MTDLEARLRQTMQSVADTTTIPPAPVAAAAAKKPSLRHRLGRRITALIAAGGIGVIGVGAAAASGAFSHQANVAFHGADVDLTRAVQIAAMRGPAGTTIRAFEAPSHHGQGCIAFTIAGDPAYPEHQLTASCGPDIPNGPSTSSHQAGITYSDLQLSVGDKPTIAVFAIPGGPVVKTAYVAIAGTRHAVDVAYGYIVGWLGQCDFENATLVGLDQDGQTVLRETHLGRMGVDTACPSS